MRILCSILFTAVSVTTLDARAQDSGRDDAEQYVLRTYEVGDLIMTISDRPYSEALQSPTGGGGGRGFGGGGGGFFNVEAQPISAQIRFAQRGGFGGAGIDLGAGGLNASDHPSVTMDSLIDVITSVIEWDTWGRAGGEVRQVGAALVVWQTVRVHQQIEALLKSLRDGSGNRKTMRIDARWLLLNSDQLDQLLSGESSQIDREVLGRFTRRPSSIRGVTNCFSGQLVYLVSGTRRNVVQSWIPVVGSVDDPNSDRLQLAMRDDSVITLVSQQEAADSGRSVGYQPVVSTPNFGALLEIRPTLVRGDDRVTVDLKSTITVPGELRDDAARDPAIAYGAPAVDRIAIETQEFATTLRIPLGQPFLVGGMTYAPTSNDPRATAENAEADKEKPQLYLILELR